MNGGARERQSDKHLRQMNTLYLVQDSCQVFSFVAATNILDYRYGLVKQVVVSFPELPGQTMP